MTMKKIGIFGGTFNPIHQGHIKAALGFLKAAELDRLIIMPAKTPPHKTIEGHDDPMLRYHMTKLAIEEADSSGKMVVSDLELRREGKSYSYDTVKALKESENGDIYLYCGTDMLLSFDRWYRFEEILSLCTLAYAGREMQSDSLKEEVEEKIKLLCDTYGADILTIPLEPIETSSSEVREKLAKGEDVGTLLPPAVYQYIKENHLYGNDI